MHRVFKVGAVLLVALIGRSRTGEASFLVVERMRIWVEESAYCGHDRRDVPRPPRVASRDIIRSSDAIGRRSGAISAVLTVTADGRVADVAITQQTPDGKGLARLFRRDFVDGWHFEPGAPGSYCVTVTYDPESKPRPPWDNPSDPIAPRPSFAQGIDYPDSALASRVTALVTLAIVIDRNGEVTDVAILSDSGSPHGFGADAKASVETWRFAGARPGRYRMNLKIEPPPA